MPHVLANAWNAVTCTRPTGWLRRGCAARACQERGAVCTEGEIFPFLDRFEVGDKVMDSGTVIGLLEPFLTEQRKERILKVICLA